MRAWPWPAVGVLLVLAALLQPVLAYRVDAAWGQGLLAMMAAELVTGRELAIPLAAAAGVPPLWIAATSILQNLGLAALIVPIVGRGVEAAELASGAWARFVRELHGAASRQVHQARSAVALFVFMLVPFLANGAVIAGVIGVLAGLRPRAVAIVLSSAVLVTSLAWAYAHAWLADALASVDPLLAWLPAAIAGIAALVWVVKAWVRART